jgi:hypothetical protein
MIYLSIKQLENMKKHLYKLTAFCFVSALFLSCSTTEIPLEEEPEPIIETVSYTADVKTIIDSNCISCHATGGQASFLPLVNYSQVKTAAETGSLISRMNNQAAPMPQGGLLSLQVRAVIDKWKADGFLEN